MNKLTIAVPVEHATLARWEEAFTQHLLAHEGAKGIELSRITAPAGESGETRETLQIKLLEEGKNADPTKTIGVVIAALSLSVSAAQLDLNRDQKLAGQSNGQPEITLVEPMVAAPFVETDGVVRDFISSYVGLKGSPSYIQLSPVLDPDRAGISVELLVHASTKPAATNDHHGHKHKK